MAKRRRNQKLNTSDPGGQQLNRITSLAAALEKASERERKAIQEVGKLFQRVTAANGTDPKEAQDIAFKLQRNMARNRARMQALLRHLNSLQDEITRLQAALKEKVEEAHRDPLTSLPNRRALDLRIGDLSNSDCAVLLVDLDHFKRINDEYGHDAGDKVLRAAAQVLRSNVRDRDFVARLGGEEFIVLLPGEALAGATRVADKLRERIAAIKFTRRGTGDALDLKVTTSIGLSIRKAAEPFDHAIKRADVALYAAKGAGRNRVLTEEDVRASEPNEASESRESTKTGVFLATEDESLCLI